MKIPRPFILLSIVLWSLNSARADDLAVTGNLTVTGAVVTGGQIDSDSNKLSFGSGATAPVELIYVNADADTFTFSTLRNPASWLWQHSAAAAMRLDSAHQLILYQADGLTPGLTFAPASNSIKLGTHANGTLTADANGVITAGGGFTVAGNFTNTSGTLTGGASGLNLNAGGTNQNITLSSSGAGDLIFNTNGVERARIKSTGNVGIGTTTPVYLLTVKAAAGLDTNISLDNTTSGARWLLQQKTTGDFAISGADEYMRILANGNVGIGTTSPTQALSVNGNIEIKGNAGNRYIITDETNTGTTKLTVQAGAGSSGFGGAINLFGHANAAKPGWVQIGISSGAGVGATEGRFTINDQGLGGGTDLLTVLRTGNVGIGTTSPTRTLDVVGTGRYSGDLTTLSNIFVHGSTGQDWALRTNAVTANFEIVDWTSTVPRVSIKPDGNVGIGTTSPQAKLDVAGVVNIPANTWFTGNGNGLLRDSYFGYSSSYRAIQIGSQLGSETGNSQAIALGIDPATITGGAFFGDEIALPNQVEFMQANSGKTDWIQNVLVLNNGNVGIGTSNPSAKLHIYSTGQPEVALESSSRKWSMFSNEGWANGGLGFYNYNSGATALYIGPGNNVGIGTTNPSALLDVYGSLGSTRVSGNQITHVYNAEANPRWQIDRDAGGSGLAGIKFGSGGVSALDTTIARISGGGISVTGGNVGIGTTNPGSKLELSSIAQTVLMITGDSDNAGGDAGYTGITLSWAGAEKWNIGPAGTGGNGLVFRRGGSSNDVIIDATGNVGIGTTSPTHKLAVNGTIRAKEVIVDTGWADYVFEDDYRLAPLAEVESHIKAKKHLPGIPSASEVAEHGVSMGDMQARLLSKIEEITLHQIAQEKQMIAQQKLLAEQSNRLSAQSTRIERLEQENRQLRAQTTTP